MISLCYHISRPGCRSAIQARKDSSMTGYCMRCRERRDIQDAQQVTMKNGRPATRGKCGDCGTTIFRIGAAT